MIQIVTVIKFGEIVKRKVVVEDKGDVLIVTTEKEWADAQKESRPPVVVGFRREYVTSEIVEENL